MADKQTDVRAQLVQSLMDKVDEEKVRPPGGATRDRAAPAK